MYASLMLIAMASYLPAPESLAEPTWLTNYGHAQKAAAHSHKPLAVVLGPGANGWQKLIRGSELSVDAGKLLAEKYVCVHIDSATPEGQALASGFEMPGGVGIVISDHTGKLQAFRHEGELADALLLAYLNRYADPDYIVRTTETNPSARASYYYAPPAPVPSGSYCPS